MCSSTFIIILYKRQKYNFLTNEVVFIVLNGYCVFLTHVVFSDPKNIIFAACNFCF